MNSILKYSVLIINFIFLSRCITTHAQNNVEMYWENPLNGVKIPFIMDSISEDVLVFNNTIAFDTQLVQSIEISDAIMEHIFGPGAVLTPSSPVQNYNDLLDTLLIYSPAFSLYSNWGNKVSDPNYFNSFITNNSLLLSARDLGVIMSYDWDNIPTLIIKDILDPTIPIIEGDDLDYSTDIPVGINRAYDREDFITNQEELQAIIDYQIYTFNHDEFKATYDDFVFWMQSTKPIVADSVTYTTYHIWLEEYFNQFSINKIQEIGVKTPIPLIPYELLNNTIYLNTKDELLVKIYNLQGKEIIKTNKKEIHLNSLTKGIYFIEIHKGKKIQFIKIKI